MASPHGMALPHGITYMAWHHLTVWHYLMVSPHGVALPHSMASWHGITSQCGITSWYHLMAWHHLMALPHGITPPHGMVLPSGMACSSEGLLGGRQGAHHHCPAATWNKICKFCGFFPPFLPFFKKTPMRRAPPATSFPGRAASPGGPWGGSREVGRPGLPPGLGLGVTVIAVRRLIG